MIRALFAALSLAVAVPTIGWSAELAEGNWRLSYGPNSISDTPTLIIKVEKKDGKLTGSQVAAQQQWKFDSIKVDGDKVHIDFSIGERKLTFEGVVGKDSKRVRGFFGDEQFASRGTLAATDSDSFQTPNPMGTVKAPESYAAVQKMTTEMSAVQRKMLQTKEPDDKAELSKKLAEMRKDMEAKAPALYRETVEKHADSPFAVEAANQLLRTAAKSKASAQDVSVWVKLIQTDAEEFGPKIAESTSITLAETLSTSKDYAPQALEIATKLSSGLKESTALSIQSRILKTLKAAQTAAGKLDDAKATDAKLAKVEDALDKEYVAKVPPFKPTPYSGRKDGANRVAVMELFTGAQCPPCVAADVAFDALEKAYKSTDLVLIQYHMHIPGPDPLTNLDTIARWDYYREKFPQGVRGTPTMIFNGKVMADINPKYAGGGGMANAKKKYDEFTEVLQPLLEEKTTIKIDGTIAAKGDKLSINIGATGIDATGPVKLRLLLVEESIRYVGGNGLRFHHQVVRALPGGAKGVEVKDNAAKQSTEVDLKEVRNSLTKYLDDFSKDRPFPYADRPLDLKHLKVIALIQNDDTREILNAHEFDVK